MTKKKILKLGLITIGAGVLIAAGITWYMFNMPHRNIQASTTDYKVKASEIVNEYLTDSKKANEKYLDEDGESGVLEVTGQISSIGDDFNNQKVVMLQAPDDKAGVRCAFTMETSNQVTNLQKGQEIVVKGVIRSGASYDKDLGMYEHVILEKCALVP